MSGIFGALGLQDTDRSFVNVIGQRVVYDAVQQVLSQHNADLAAAYGVFVERETEDFKFRYKLPGGGYLQRRGANARPASVKAYGSWDVAFPLEDFGADLADNDVALAYMSMQELNRHLDTIIAQDINTVRREILKAMFNNTNLTFEDPINGSLTCVPLANADAVVYPPVIGSDTEATDDHYLESGYAAASISDTNNPFKTIRDELEEHFGAATGGENLFTFINNAQVTAVESLTDFDPVNDRFTAPGTNTDQLFGLPAGMPGRIVGRCNGVWVIEWRWIPANYMLGGHLDAPKPLIMRLDPANTGLARGLNLVGRDEEKPLESSFYRHRFGLGVGNRLNGVAFELGTGGSYTIPTAYAR